MGRVHKRGLRRHLAVLLGSVSLGAVAAHATDGTWLAAPATNNWNVGTNWTSSPIVPDGIASFGASTKTSLTFSAASESIGTMQFNAGAPAYTFTQAATQLTVNGSGIVNNSSNRPTFLLDGLIPSLNRCSTCKWGNCG